MITWLLYKFVRFPVSTIRCNGRTLKVFVADNPARQMLGLMHRQGLRSNEGMLFIFGNNSKWGIWMANMKFSIDIIWIDRTCTVVDIKKGAEPCNSIFNCKTFIPKTESKYVLEVNSGGASRYRIKKGDRLRFR